MVCALIDFGHVVFKFWLLKYADLLTSLKSSFVIFPVTEASKNIKKIQKPLKNS